ncbi:MAG: hypothetical protein QOE41_2647 [Mycobacterium sp.]|jgi:nucleoside-diphosphate-sugar epimerase|nr:hypothetical protein [Mycobacterium sp.]MDT5133336.1 hypothetical protein [Mycobacterium sp.]
MPPDGSRALALPAFEVSVKRSLERIALDYAVPWEMGGSATAHANQKLNQHLLDVAVLRIPTQFGPGYKEMGSPISRAVHTVAGKGNLMAGAGYMGVPVSQLWSVIAVSALTYVRDTADALLRMIQADALPHRDLQPVQRLHHQCPRTAADPLPDTPDAARQVNLDPETLRGEPYPSNGYNADLLTRDTGWRPQYTVEEAFEDYLKWLGEHPY